jgi:hypothetical protein
MASIEVSPTQLEAIKVLDPRLTLNSANNRKYGVLMGPGQNSFREVISTSFSNSNATILANPPSPQIGVSRLVFIGHRTRTTFTGVSQPGNVLLQTAMPNANGIRPAGNVASLVSARNAPLNQILQNLTVTLGNASFSSNICSYHRALTRYHNLVDQRNINFSMSPSMPDPHFEYVSVPGSEYQWQYSARNPLGAMIDNPNEEPRGSFVGCKVISNTANEAVVEMFVVEPIWLSPFTFQRGDSQVALFGIGTLSLQMTFGSRAGPISYGLWSIGRDPTLSTINNVAVETLAVTSYWNYVTPQLTMNIPREMVYSYNEPTNYITAFQAPINPGQTQLLNFNSVQFSAVPQLIYIFVGKRASDTTYYDTDTFLSIQSISCTWQNQDGLLSSASVYDLYQNSVRNGCNMSYRQWTYDCGSVLCLEMGTDINLQNTDAPGVRGLFNWSFQIGVLNQTNEPVVPEINCLVSLEGIVTITDSNSVIRSVGVLSQENVLQTIATGQIVPYTPPRNVYGGGWFDSVKSFFTKTLPKIARTGVNVASSLGVASPYLNLVDEGLKLSGNGRSRARLRRRGGAGMSRAELEDMLQ